MPSATASAGPCSAVSAPSQRIAPASAGKIPEMILMSVDLPAPLSPTSATTSPGRTWNRTSVRACTAPNRLLMPRSSRNGPGRAKVMRSSRSSGGGNELPPPNVRVRLLDACGLTGRGELRGADLGHRVGAVELVGDDGVLDRLGARDLAVEGDGDRNEQDRRHVRGAVVDDLATRGARRGLVALREVTGERRGGLGLRLGRFVDRPELVARQDPLDAGDLRVLPGDELRLRIDAAGLHRGDRAARAAVVRDVGAIEAGLAERGDELLHELLGLGRQPVRHGVFLDDLGLAREGGLRALVEERGVVVLR